MNERINEANKIEKAILVGLSSGVLSDDERSTDETMDELAALLETAGGVPAARVLQNRNSPDSRTFIGDGKVREVRALAESEGADIILFDNELSPSQTKALEEETGRRVLDRASLILDIFAVRAQTREGRLQVELAQYKYLLPRLTRMWTHLERQAGTAQPIGTRGPGETQLETDRRHIRRKIQKLEEELKEVQLARATQRRWRLKNDIPVLALVGYTNAGKSTILNMLSGAGIPARNRLFDTLDTTTRRIKLNASSEALLSDTVGFIRKLPHHLVKAFRATLEELKYADVILHVIDASSPQWQAQRDVTDKLIAELGCAETPRIEIYNKMDIAHEFVPVRGDNTVALSAVTGKGTEELLAKIAEVLEKTNTAVTLRVPYGDAWVINEMYSKNAAADVRYEEDAIYLSASLQLDTEGYDRYGKYITETRAPDEIYAD